MLELLIAIYALPATVVKVVGEFAIKVINTIIAFYLIPVVIIKMYQAHQERMSLIEKMETMLEEKRKQLLKDLTGKN